MITGKTADTPPGPSGPIPRKPWHKRRWVRITGVIIGALVVIIALANHSGMSPAAATAPAKSATPKAQPPKAQPPKATPKSAKPAPAAPASSAQPSRPAPAQSTQRTAPPAAAAPAGCHPLSNEGTCYEPGEYCRNADHGVSGMAGDGEAITCEYNNGWRWEPAAAAPAQPSSPAPAQSTQPTAPPAAAAPAGCHPLSNEGTCYEPGEYCRNADHGVSGMAGDGEAITCEYNNGWRWEPA